MTLSVTETWHDQIAAATNDTGLVNTAPYEGGWLFKIKISDPAQVDALMTEAAYLEFAG